MDITGFPVTRAEYEAKSDLLLQELDAIVTDEVHTVLQVILTWDEFATLAPALDKASREQQRGKIADYNPYSVGMVELPAPEPKLLGKGTYKGIELYVRERPVPTASE